MDPSSIRKPFPLLSLPAEIIGNIVAVCTKQVLKSLRLSCKILEITASEFLLERVCVELLPRKLSSPESHIQTCKILEQYLQNSFGCIGVRQIRLRTAVHAQLPEVWY